jgi:energy-coupling factor transport system ATP-binding protein
MTLIEFRNYSFTHLGQRTRALNGINLKIEEGTVVGILGVGGSGKSTLIKSMGGLTPVEVPGIPEGEIIIDGEDSRKLAPVVYSQKVGVVLDKPATQLLGLTVLNDVSFGPSNLGLDEKEVLERVEFALTVTRLKGFEKRNPEELSGGQQQSLAIADILAMKPKVLAMDEPVSMLDAEGKERVLSIVRSLAADKSSTVVITESGLDLESIIKYLDRLVVLSEGKVVLDGTPAEVIGDPLLDQVGVGRTQLADLFVKIRAASGKGSVPYTLEDAQKAIRPLLSGKRFSFAPPEASAADSPDVVSTSNLWHTYLPDVQALKGVDLEVKRGDIVGLIGQNGCGKTTLCLHLVGVLKPTNPEAKVNVCGVDVPHERTQKVIRKVNYVFQNPDNQLFQESISHELSYGLRLIGTEDAKVASKVAETMKEFDLEPYAQYEMVALPRDIRTILAMASVMTLGPEVLVLDEPTNAMDRRRSRWFVEKLRALRDQGLTIMIVSHNMELLAKVCNRLIVMSDGKVLAQGETRSVFMQTEVLDRAKVKPPQVAQLAQSLRDVGFPPDVLTADEFFAAMGGGR